MRRLLAVIIAILVLFVVCAALEKEVSSDGTATQTEAIWTETVNSLSDAFGQIKDGISTMFSSISDKLKSDDSANTEIGEISVDQLPEDAQEYYERYEEDNWETTSEDLEGKTKAGDDFDNEPRNEDETKLPEETTDGTQITYKEFDAETTPVGQMRGTKRFVRGSDGSTYYTDDHYKTFKRIID